MDNAGHGRMGKVADRIGTFPGVDDEFARVGQILPRHRSVTLFNQASGGGRHSNGVTCGDLVSRPHNRLSRSIRPQPAPLPYVGLDEVSCRAFSAATLCRQLAPRAHLRCAFYLLPALPAGSKPSAQPLACGMAATAAQEININRILLAIKLLLQCHVGLETAGAVLRHLSARQRRSRVQHRRHRVQTAQPHADRRVWGRASAASLIGYSIRITGRPTPSCGSMRVTSNPERMSGQVSSGATRMPDARCLCGESVPVRAAIGINRGHQVDSGETVAGLRDRHPLRLGTGVAGSVFPVKLFNPSAVSAARASTVRAVLHQHVIACTGAVPFQHREFGMMQRPCFAIAEGMGEREKAAVRLPPAASCRQIPVRCSGTAGGGCRPC